ncbi:ornithine carbamoyltransferase [Brevundimonas sp.]|uniref:ornithine carbamoyltransferase n=1 Tax=Brevundimonas sp. TaxID=1871086 RepID=UPI0025F3B447|nr:ornithine carbamoyltransferase [Brevundimonas sp.]
MAVRHFLDIWRLDDASLRAILDDAHARKRARAGWPKGRVDADAPAKDLVLAMVFEKNSTRTRFSFDAAIRQLGGASIIANASDMQLGRGETVEDTARVLSRMVDAVMIRANSHEDVLRFAQASDVPVINGLTDKSHPCQILADLMTIEERLGPIAGKTVAWVGDGNNVCASLIHAAPKFGFTLRIACPGDYHPDLYDLARGGNNVSLGDDPQAAVGGADVVVTDTWVSMGDQDHEARLAAFERFSVDEALMESAASNAVFLHCLPAHRGEEVTDAVLDGPQSAVWDEAENRIHAQKAVLAWCLAGAA